jgi:DNA-directed RNA polymerase specialized sigma24 family protein
MTGSDDASHLSRISTRWEELMQAQHGRGAAASNAQQAILCRYCGAIYRYLLSMVRDPDTAEELSQEFALRFVRKGFKGVRPDRGRFRDFVKKSLSNLVADHYRRLRTRAGQLSGDELPDSAEAADASDVEFIRHWRGELLGRAWENLAAEDAEHDRLFHAVLRWRVENPGEPAARRAESLHSRSGKPFTEGNIRVTLHRARERFADLLLDEVARSLETADRQRIEQELIDLDLFTYCRPALQRRART